VKPLNVASIVKNRIDKKLRSGIALPAEPAR
jgi:hypothetical protein